MVEVGAGWGALAEILVQNGFRCEGVEPSEAMAAHCRERGLPVRQGEIDQLPEKTYSALVMCSVFEHLVEHEEWLRKANRLLRTGDVLISGQPTAHFLHFAACILRLGRTDAALPQLHQGFCPPWHTVLFSISGMETLLSRHGFGLVEIRSMPQGGTRDHRVRAARLRACQQGGLVRVRHPVAADHRPPLRFQEGA